MTSSNNNTNNNRKKKEDPYFLVKFSSTSKPTIYRATELESNKKPAGKGGDEYLRLNVFTNKYEKPTDIQPISDSEVKQMVKRGVINADDY